MNVSADKTELFQSGGNQDGIADINPTMLIVLGVHRSGTSVAARMLECLGAENSNVLIQPNLINTKGFFEDKDIYEFNEFILLPQLGSSWESISLINWDNISTQDRSKLISEALEILKRNYSSAAPLKILKEPRISTLLPFYLSVLNQARFEVKVVCVLRDPLSVARSLNKAQGLSITHAAMLYVSNWLSILSSIQNLPVAFVQYDEMLLNPSKELISVASKLGIRIQNDFIKNIEELSSSFLDRNLRHSTINLIDLTLESELPPISIELYKSLLAAHKLQNIKETDQARDYCKSLLASQQHINLEYDRLYRNKRAMQKQICELQSLLELELQNTKNITQAISLKDANIQKTQTMIAEKEGVIAEKERVIAEKERVIAEKERVIAEKKRVIRDLQEEIHLRDLDLYYNKAYVESVQSSWSWRLTAPLRAIDERSKLSFQTLKRQLMAAWIIWIHLKNGTFDRQWYINANNDVKLSGMNAWLHFGMYGFHEGRAPNSDFYASCNSFNKSTAIEIKPRALARFLRPPIERLLPYTQDRWPLISVVMPTYNTPITFLDRAIESVLTQTYPYWELCIADDGSSNEEVIARLKVHADNDARIKLVFDSKNSGISTATNSSIAIVSGAFTAFLDHDDELTTDALAEVAVALLENPAADVVYSDQDKIDENGMRFEPFHKPAWSPIYLQGVMYIGHLLVVRSELLRKVGGCNSQYNRIQDFELMLRLSEADAQIVHIPKILYHWRALPGSIAASTEAKGSIERLQVDAVQSHLDRLLIPLKAKAHSSLPHRIQLFPAVKSDLRLVSIIIPTKNAHEHIRRCLDTLFGVTRGCAFEVIIADNGTTDSDALEALNAYPIKRIDCQGPFNFSRSNNIAAREAKGEFLLFLNNDTEVVDPDWLLKLLGHHSLPNVGAVGPVLIYPSGTVQHAGVAIGARGTADHIMRHANPLWDGYAGSLPCAHEVSAVTAACMMMPYDLFMELGGFNEDYARHYQDTDLCLRIRQTGRSVLYVGNVTLKHHESASRGKIYDMVDRAIFQDRWISILNEGDPFYNANLCLNRLDYSAQ